MAKSEDGKWVLDLLDEEDVPMPQEIEEISLTLRLLMSKLMETVDIGRLPVY